MALSPQRATDLRTAYRICDLTPLEGEDLRYYVQLNQVRQSEAVMNVSTMLYVQEPGEFCTILFTGHRGCGKSTELHCLRRNWEQSYRTVYMEVDEETDINDVTFTDLYLLAAKYVEFALRSEGLRPDERIIKDFEDWFRDVTRETEESVNQSVSVAAEASLQGGAPFLAKLLVKLLAQIKASSQEKTTIRQVLERDFSRLKANINLLFDDCLRQLRSQNPACKGLLLVFDNLDRCPPHVANRLFFDYAAQLQELHCSVLYTVPLATVYSPLGISNSFKSPNIVPMVRVYDYGAEPNQGKLPFKQEALQAFTQIVRKRVEVERVFGDEADLLRLAEASGGHVRHLMQMMREACLTAIGRGHRRIEAEDVTYAIKQLQFDFERQIPDQHYPVIARTFRDKKISNDEIGQQALFNTSVLEYNGDHRWNYPHALVIRIDAFQRALEQLDDPE